MQVQRSTLVLPAFVMEAPTWTGASLILAEYAVGNTGYFSVRQNIETFGENFVLAVRYVVDNVVLRYKFWEGLGEVLYYPVYNGEKLGPNAVFEIWSVNSASTPSLSTNQTLETSLLVFPPNQTCNACCENPSNQYLLTASAPSFTDPCAYCNPFILSLSRPGPGTPETPPTPPTPPVPLPLFPIPDPYGCEGEQTVGVISVYDPQRDASNFVGVPDVEDPNAYVAANGPVGCIEGWVGAVWADFLAMEIEYLQARVEWVYAPSTRLDYLATTVFPTEAGGYTQMSCPWKLQVRYCPVILPS